jgi:YVTN family beta-propeller protein
MVACIQNLTRFAKEHPMKRVILLFGIASLIFFTSRSYAAGGYRLAKTIPIPGNGSWDYIGMDSVNRHVLISHGPQLEIMDADTYQLVGKIPEPSFDFSKPETLAGQGVRGGAAAPELGRGFVPNARDGSVSIFDLKTLKVLARVKVGEDPDGYVYDPATQRGFTFSNHTKAAAAVDIAKATLAGTVPLGSKPEAGAADGAGHVFVNMQQKDAVDEIDSRKLAVEQSWPTAPCHEPTSMAMDTKNNRLFIGCRGDSPMLEVMDASNGKIITTLPIGGGTDAAAFDPEKRLIFTSNGEGSISVILQQSADKYTNLETVKTEPGARTMALDLKTHKLFLINADRTTPPAVAGQPQPRPEVVPGTFRVLVVAPD